MKQSTILALGTTFLASMAIAKPMVHPHLHKRGMVTVTVTEDILEIVNVIITIFNDADTSTGTSTTQTTRNGSPSSNAAEATSSSQPAAVNTPTSSPTLAASPAPTSPPTNDKPSALEWQNGQQQKQEELIKEQEKKIEEQQKKNEEQNKINGQSQQQADTPSSQEQQAASSSVSQQVSGNSGDVSQGGGNNDGSSEPSGGACGQVGGKCKASDLTVYTDSAMGACGWDLKSESQDFFALAANTMGPYSNSESGDGGNKNAFCGRMATISVNGKQFSAKLTDKCPGCQGWSIDVSISLWNKLYPEEKVSAAEHSRGTRKFNVDWWFTSPQIYHPLGG